MVLLLGDCAHAGTGRWPATALSAKSSWSAWPGRTGSAARSRRRRSGSSTRSRSTLTPRPLSAHIARRKVEGSVGCCINHFHFSQFSIPDTIQINESSVVRFSKERRKPGFHSYLKHAWRCCLVLQLQYFPVLLFRMTFNVYLCIWLRVELGLR